MDGSTNPNERAGEHLSLRNYRAELEQCVRESEEHLTRTQERFDREEERAGKASSDWSNRHADRLADAKASLKAARARLAAYKKLPHEELEAEVLKLKFELYPDRIAEAMMVTRPLAIAAAIASVRAFVKLMAVREQYFEKLRRLRNIERELLSDESHDLPPIRQPGFALLEGAHVRADRASIVAALERLAGSDDEIAKALTRDAKGGLVVAGLPVRIALDWAHIA